jgi:predicted nucleotidyltransferase
MECELSGDLTAMGLRDVVQDATARLARRLSPLRIYLFGSAARGTMSPDSDLDFLVVMPDGSNCRRLMVEAHRELCDLPVAKDVLVTTPSRLEVARDDIGSVLCNVLEEGRSIDGRRPRGVPDRTNSGGEGRD